MILWLALMGCRADEDVASGDSGASTPVDAPTYYADISPLMATHCTRCHNPQGLGMGDFTSPDEVTLLAPAIAAAVSAGRMPPPASDPSCNDYVGSDILSLSDEDKRIIADWAAADAPLGDPADEPVVEPTSHDLTDPDLTLLMSEGYTPTYADPDSPANEYRCFLLERPEGAESFYITAMAPVIGEESIAHHAVLFTSGDETLKPYMDDLTDGDGLDCMEGLSSVDGMLTAWAPGMMPIEFPEGSGLHVAADEHVILQMHYYSSGPDTKGLTDQSGYAFRTATEVDKTMYMAPVGAFDFEIPAGDDNYTHVSSFENSYVDLQIYGMFPHMHVLGQSYSATVRHADGSESCLVEGDYDFSNQMTYQFSDPVSFANGDTIEFSCNWNNSESNPDLPSDEPKDTYYGERTDEEMCYFFTFVSI